MKAAALLILFAVLGCASAARVLRQEAAGTATAEADAKKELLLPPERRITPVPRFDPVKKGSAPVTDAPVAAADAGTAEADASKTPVRPSDRLAPGNMVIVDPNVPKRMSDAPVAADAGPAEADTAEAQKAAVGRPGPGRINPTLPIEKVRADAPVAASDKLTAWYGPDRAKWLGPLKGTTPP